MRVAAVLLVVVVASASAVVLCPFVVVQLNAWNADDGEQWPRRRALLGELVRESAPDCVAFEEVRRGGHGDMLADLQGELGADLPHWEYAKASVLTENEKEEGVAVACRWPLLAVDRTEMPPLKGCYDPLTRAALHVVVNATERVVDVVVTHWSYAPCNQHANAQATLGFVERVARTSVTVLLGDFNAYEEENAALQFLQRSAVRLVDDDENGTKTRFVDAWRSLHPVAKSDPGFTFSSLQQKGGLHNRCDRVLVAGTHVVVDNASVVCHTASMMKKKMKKEPVTRIANAQSSSDSSIAFNDPLQGEGEDTPADPLLHPSDHCALVVRLLVPYCPSCSSSTTNSDDDDDETSITFSPSTNMKLFLVFSTAFCAVVCATLARQLCRR